MNLGAAIDSFIGLFSPEMAYKRAFYRAARSGNLYSGAKSTRLSPGAWGDSPGANDLIRASNAKVKAFAQQLIRDFPYFKSADDAMSAFTVGDGIKYQSKIREPNGDLATDLNQKIESAWLRWSEMACVDGRLQFPDLTELFGRQIFGAGESLAIHTTSEDPKRYLPYCLQMIEAEHLDDTTQQFGDVVTIDQGIEYKSATGERIAYILKDTGLFYNSDLPKLSQNRIPAERVIHGFHTLRPGQLRGISELNAALHIADMLWDYMTAELGGVQMASKWLAFIESPDPAARQNAIKNMQIGPDGLPIVSPENTEQKIESMSNGILEYLRTGEKIHIASAAGRIGGNFPDYIRTVLLTISCVTGIPYEIVTKDYNNLGYTNFRTARNDMQQLLRPIISRHIRQFCEPVKRVFLDFLYLSGKIDMPGYVTDPWAYYACTWDPAGMKPIDPLKENKANDTAIKTYQKSPQEIARERGVDFQDLLAEIAEANRMIEAAGLPTPWMEETSNANANNPAAVAEQG